MRPSTDRLIFRAVAALYGVALDAAKGPVAATPTLRFALAFLYAHSDGTLDPYTDFLKHCQNPYADAYSPSQASDLRLGQTMTNWHGIVRSLGIRQDINFMSKVRDAAR